MDCSLPHSSICGIFQARILEWVAISFSRASSLPRDWTRVSHIVGRHFTIWATREVLTNLDSMLKRRDITLPTKVCVIKAMVFPAVMYGCESCTIKKAERRRMDAFELWCWRRLLRVPWTARRSNQFSSVTQSCLTLCDPMNRSTPGLPVHHHLPGFTQTHVHRVTDAIQPSHPLSSPSPPAPNPSQHQSQWVNSSHEVAKVLEFQL